MLVWRNEWPWGYGNVLDLLLTFGDFEILVEPDDRHHGGHRRRKICVGLKLVVGAQRDKQLKRYWPQPFRATGRQGCRLPI
jgi:hypothetical protein